MLNFGQLAKAVTDINSTFSGIIICFKLKQFLNASSGIILIFFGILISSIPLSSKHPFSISSIVSCKCNFNKLFHL